MIEEPNKESPFSAIVELARGRDNSIILNAIKAISILSLTSLVILFTGAADYIKLDLHLFRS